jgi:hypothetical protein
LVRPHASLNYQTPMAALKSLTWECQMYVTRTAWCLEFGI